MNYRMLTAKAAQRENLTSEELSIEELRKQIGDPRL